MATPIWQDTAVRYMSQSGEEPYTISVDGEVVYKGKLVQQPSEAYMTLYINRIAKDYLSSKIDFTKSGTTFQQPKHKRSFAPSGVPVVGEKAYSIYNDWSYENINISKVCQVISRPLSNIVDPRQRLFVTAAKLSNGDAGVVRVVSCDPRCSTFTEAKPNPCVTFAYSMNNIAEGTIINVEEGNKYLLAQYEVRNTCAEYCLYYLNAHGGYDHLLIKGTTLRTDTFNRTEITQSVDNTTLAHGKQTIASEVASKWRLNTDYLTDAQWKLTHHLLGSSHVMLHDLTTDEIIPVNITSSTAEFKSYRNQGNKKSYLTIEVEASAKRMRK